MLSHSSTTIPGQHAPYHLQRAEAAWTAIESELRKREIATTAELAAVLGLSPSATQSRLNDLREMGEVRFAESRGKKIRAWALGAEEFVVRAEQMRPTITKAVQLGSFTRDPLVAALFGFCSARCVGCHSPQGAPHEEGCVFVGVDIDAIHHRAAA